MANKTSIKPTKAAKKSLPRSAPRSLIITGEWRSAFRVEDDLMVMVRDNPRTTFT